MTPEAAGVCYAIFIVNEWKTGEPAKIQVDLGGNVLPIAQFTRIPSGTGTNIVYDPYDANAGLPTNQVAVLFLSRDPAGDSDPTPTDPRKLAKCPPDVLPAVNGDASLHGTGKATAFHIKTNVPVVAYSMLPYGGGSARVTGSTLLLPTNAWGDNYVAVNAYEKPTAFTRRSRRADDDDPRAGRQHDDHDQARRRHRRGRRPRGHRRGHVRQLHDQQGRVRAVHAAERAHGQRDPGERAHRGRRRLDADGRADQSHPRRQRAPDAPAHQGARARVRGRALPLAGHADRGVLAVPHRRRRLGHDAHVRAERACRVRRRPSAQVRSSSSSRTRPSSFAARTPRTRSTWRST